MQISISNAIGGGGGTQGGGTPTPPPFSNVNSFLFDGVDEKMFSTANYTEINGAQNFSVSFWLKPIDSNDGVVFRFGKQGSTSRLACIYYPSLEIVIISFGTSSYYYRSVNGSIPLNQWSHIVYTYDGTQSRYNRPEIYVNGVLSQGTNTGITSSQSNFDGTLELGGTGTSGQQNFGNNYIDEFAVWNSTTLTQTQANELYNGGTPSDLNNIASGLAQPTTWFRCGDLAVWNGFTWTMTDVNGGTVLRAANMQESSRTTDVPPNPFVNTKSILLDGVDDYVEIGSPTSIQSLTSAITISAWIKAPRTFATNYYTLASKGEYAAAGSQWSIRINTANARNTAGGVFSVFPNSNAITDNQVLTFPTPVDDNQWHHMMFVNDGTDLKVYIDGVLDATGTGKGRTLYNGSRTLRLGRLTASTTQKLIGNLDEVAIFGTALQLSDAQSIYNGGVPNNISSLSPISWWRCGDGDTAPILTDNGSGGNNGTMTNFSTFSTDVPFNYKSILLDGVDDYVDCADNDNLSFGNGTSDSPFSISAWVKMTDATRFRVVGKLNGSNAEYAFFTSASDQLYIVLYDNNTSNRISRYTSSTLTSYEGTWIHLAATYNGSGNSSGLKIYLNNTRIDNTTSNVGAYTAMHNTSAPFEIGKYLTSSANGLIDEFSIFNTELSASDVTSIYNSGVPNDISSLSPLSWWRCGDGDTAPTLTDNGSASNDGTMTNFTTFSTDVPT